MDTEIIATWVRSTIIVHSSHIILIVVNLVLLWSLHCNRKILNKIVDRLNYIINEDDKPEDIDGLG